MGTNLTDLATKYQTDKLQHGYIPFYEQHLPKNPRKILEIGVDTGASIKMWREYFPDSEIHGLDLFSDKPVPEIDNVTFHTGNQCDWRVLERLRAENFDIIIDDGSHNSRDQLITFFGLFNGGHYFIEDCHCNFDEFWRQGLPFEYTAINVLPRLHGISFVHNDKIALIYAHP